MTRAHRISFWDSSSFTSEEDRVTFLPTQTTMNRRPFLLFSRQTSAIRHLSKPAQYPSYTKFIPSLPTQPATRVASRQISQLSISRQEFMNRATKIDEKALPTYLPEHYYPVHSGEIFKHRYLVIT